MQKLMAVVAILLVTALPVFAQEATQEATEEAAPEVLLPAGCNIGTLGQIFTNTGESLSSLDITVEEAVFVIDMLDVSLAALRDACVPEEAVIDETAIDYSEIPQSRTEDGAFILGDPDAPITIVEFADFMCPHCQNYHSTVQEIINTYVATGEARFEYRFFPVVDPNLSPLTARMAECADILNPGSFWQAHDVLYGITTLQFDSLTPFTFAARTGIDYDEMVACVGSDANQVAIDVEVGQTAGVSGTPSIMVRYGDGDLEDIEIDGETVPRSSVPFELLAQVIEEAQ